MGNYPAMDLPPALNVGEQPGERGVNKCMQVELANGRVICWEYCNAKLQMNAEFFLCELDAKNQLTVNEKDTLYASDLLLLKCLVLEKIALGGGIKDAKTTAPLTGI